MTTTIVKDSIVGDKWIEDTARAVPIQYVINPDTQQPTNNILTGPVRLAFDHLFELPKATVQNSNPKYGAALLFTPFADFSIFNQEYTSMCSKKFPEYYDAQTKQYVGLHSPFRDQRIKPRYQGFTPGCIFMTCLSKFKPLVVDARRNPIIDPAKVYAGVWAICCINAYSFDVGTKKGVAFGLQQVMLIGDDKRLVGGPADPNKTFSSVSGIVAPIVRPDIAQGFQPPALPGTATAAPPRIAGGSVTALPLNTDDDLAFMA